VEFGY
jgi:hypothetical protein